MVFGGVFGLGGWGVRGLFERGRELFRKKLEIILKTIRIMRYE